MKKFFSLLLFCGIICVYTNTYAAKMDTTHLMPQVTSAQIHQDVKTAINTLATELKVTADHVYGVLIRQQMINAIRIIIIDALLLIFSIIWIIVCVKNTDTDLAKITMAATAISSMITVIVMTGTLPSMLTGFANPEYGAIQDIMKMIR